MLWERRRILIWGKTRPELSKSHREIVCTGGVFSDTRRLCRLYPIPLRYMDDERIFKKYQWIEADVARAVQDARPESYRINSESIAIGTTVPSRRGNWDERAEWVLNEENIFGSVEALQERWRNDYTSLGLVKPNSISKIWHERVGDAERHDYSKRWDKLTKQFDLPIDPESGRKILPLRAAEYRFKIRFHCSDPSCQRGHDFSVLDWDIDALYFKQKSARGAHIARQKVVEKLRDEVCADDKDLYFFLGNIATHPHVFTIVGFWWPKKKEAKLQMALF